jgi:GNAT superfamily N-acetyltransferase
MSVEIRRLAPDDRAGLEAFVAIVNSVTPEDPTSLEQLRWESDTYPGQGERLIARLDGQPVGVAAAGRIRVYRPDYERYWLNLQVMPAARRRGVGGALYAAASKVARDAGKLGFETLVSERHEDGLAFLLHRGFEVTDRDKMVELALVGRSAPAVEPPHGIELTTLAARPELMPGVHAVAVEAFADIPSSGEPIEARPYEEWVARDGPRSSIPADAFAIAVDQASGDVVGYASLELIPGSTTRAWHDMTAVLRRWRGHGVATALKRATIAWAIQHRLETLVTGNDEQNGPMRAVNASLGYTPIPDELGLRGPLAPGT